MCTFLLLSKKLVLLTETVLIEREKFTVNYDLTLNFRTLRSPQAVYVGLIVRVLEVLRFPCTILRLRTTGQLFEKK